MQNWKKLVAVAAAMVAAGAAYAQKTELTVYTALEIDQLKATAARPELDLGKATKELETAKADLTGAQGEVERLGKEVQDKVDALGAKEAEATELHASLAAAVARVKELEGYKAKAIVAEMPKPAAPAPAAP